MEECDAKLKLQLTNAFELYTNREYKQCRKVLGQIKMVHVSNESNLLMAQYKQSPNKIGTIIKKLIDILISLNIKLYQDRPQVTLAKNYTEKVPKIDHELYYWNIIVLSQLMGNAEVTELITNEALHFTDSLRTETSLMIIYQMLSIMESSGRLSSFMSLIDKQKRLISRVRKISKQEQTYHFLNQILFNRVLLKLGITEGNQNIQNKKEDIDVNEINNIPVLIYQQLLHAEIQYHSNKYPLAIKILADLIPHTDSLGKNKDFVRNIIDHNIAIILTRLKQTAPACLLMKKSLTSFTMAKQLQNHNQRSALVSKCKQNIILTNLSSPNTSYSHMYDLVRNYSNSNSYKFNYRKAQICIKFYHQLISNPQKILTSNEIHDFYQTVYYYPNQPYFQQKSKNKNPNFTNGKCYYRRYVLPEWQNSMSQQISSSTPLKEHQMQGNQIWNEGKEMKEKKKDKSSVSKNSKAKKEEQAKQQIKEEPKIDVYKARLNEVLDLSQWFLKQALTFLQKQKGIVVNLQGQQKDVAQQVNEKLQSEYIDYKGSLYSLLCYVYLCKHQWTKTVHYAQKYEQFQKMYQLENKNPAQQQIYYNTLIYKMEAYSQLSRINKSYQIMQDVINSIEYSESVQVNARSTANQQQGQVYFQTMSQYNNFCFNISVLHSRDNKIPEAYQSIQKILQQMRLSPSNPQANIPVSMIELLIHYNLRTSNNHSAIQLIKRRRILNVPGAISHYQTTLNITK